MSVRPPNGQRQPRILAVDESTERLDLLHKALLDSGFDTIHLVSTTNNLLETVTAFAPDVILIEVVSPGRDTLEQLSLVRDQHPTAVVMISQDQEAQSIQAAVASGVCAYTADGIAPDHVRGVIEVAMATFESFEKLRGELEKARQDLSTHKRVDQAKRVLMQQQGMSEEEAHKALRKLSMDRKRKLSDVADDVIAISKLFRT